MESVFDLAGLESQPLRLMISTIFRGLNQGSGFILRSDRDQREVKRYLTERFPGAWDWHLMSENDQAWSARVKKRQAARVIAADKVELFLSDHYRLNAMLEELAMVAQTKNADSLSELATRIQQELSRHFELEETELFPKIAEHVPNGSQMVQTFVAQHVESIDSVRLVSRMLAEMSDHGADWDTICRTIATLRSLLDTHLVTEETILDKFSPGD